MLPEAAAVTAQDRFEPMVTAQRVFTTRKRRRPPAQKPGIEAPGPKRRYPFEALVFDTETTTDPSQRLLVGVWRLYRDDPDGSAGITCIEEGLFYPDDLSDWDPKGYERLLRYANRHETDAAPGYSNAETGRRVLLWPLSRWLEERLHEYGYKHRDRCDVVGFNLMFDLTRVASHFGEARGQYLGGWSLGLIGEHDRYGRWRDRRFHPRLLAKSIDPRRTLFAWGSLKDGDHDHKGTNARFVDLRTLSFALTDRSHSLETACKAFGDEFKKAKVKYGRITNKLIHYARQDVAHTAALYRACLDELAQHHGIDLPAHRLYSPATVGTRYLETMGLDKPMERFDLDPRIHGWAMSAFYGGRAEARIVRTHIPVAYVDATSMYPTVNALIGTWQLLTANQLHTETVTDEVRQLLADPGLNDRCYDPAFWRDHIGVTLVQLDHPDGAMLPFRGEYDESSLDRGIGVNPLRYSGTIWYMLPDVIGATILPDGNAPPTIAQAIRLIPEGIQPGLRPIELRGGETIDPATQDPFVAMIELRQQVRQDKTRTADERDRLQQFLKITANATSYGTLARFDRRRYANQQTVTVYGPDDEPFKVKTQNPEDPGPYCFPPVAASITAAARLMLAMMERAVTDAGGSYAFCDTDSMGIVTHPTIRNIDTPTPDGTNQIAVLAPATVKAILDRFESINPYNPKRVPRLWKEEHNSLDDPLWCYAISTKRYALYRPTNDGERGLVDWSEHSIGHHADPTGPESKRDAQGRRIWIRQAWEWILDPVGSRSSLPEWADQYALTKFSLSSPATARWFTGYNRNQPRDLQIRAGNFGLIAHPDRFTPQDDPARPAAPYEADPKQWHRLKWYDRGSDQPVTITTLVPHEDPDRYAQLIGSGTVRITNLGDILANIRTRPEHKSRAPNGGPVTGVTSGLLQRRSIESAPVLTDLVGKEGNHVEERLTGQMTDPDDYRSAYGNRTDRFTTLVLPVLGAMGVDEVMRRTGRKKSAVYEVLAGRLKRRGAPAGRYREAAIAYARVRLVNEGAWLPRHPYGVLYSWLKMERERNRQVTSPVQHD